jgi:multidrug efflux pump
MALAVSVGFVVDDAIVMIENVFRNLEAGSSPLRATIEGAKQIGFTVISISVSLTAAFIPLLFMGGIIGRLFREFSLTLVFAIAVSTVVSITVTPMVCAHFVRAPPSPNATRFDRVVEALLQQMIAFYARTLGTVLRHRALTLVVMALTITLTVVLYYKVPKSDFPQDDTGLIFGSTQASTDVSYKTMTELQLRAAEIVMSDPAVAGIGSFIGTSGNASVNQGRFFISLKPLDVRKTSTNLVVDRLRRELETITGIKVFMVATRDVRVGGRQSKAQYQFTLWGPDVEELSQWVPKALEAVRALPGLTDVTTDREQGGLQANVVIDRLAASRLGVQIQDIDNALNNAFAQRQVSIVYTQRNQYRVILEIDPRFQRDPSDLDKIYVPGSGGAQVPLSAVARFEKGVAPLVVNHQGQFPAVTITYNLQPGAGLEDTSAPGCRL